MYDRKKWVLVLLCLIAAVLVVREVWVCSPSEGTVILRSEAQGLDIEDSMSKEEVMTAKRILWGRIRWPEWLYGSPACGFGRGYGFLLDGTLYMMAWDSCGTLCVKADSGAYSYINISEPQKASLKKMFDSRRDVAAEENNE